MQVSDHPGADIVKMTEFAQSNIIAMICRNAWDSKNNIAPTQLLVEAGGEGNHNHTHPMLQLLMSVQKEVQQVTHLSNQEKSKVLSKKEVGWEDILNESKELH